MDCKWKPISELPPMNKIVVGLVQEYGSTIYMLFSTHDMGSGRIVFSTSEVTVDFNRDGERGDFSHWITPHKVNAKLIAWCPIPKLDTTEFKL